MLGLSVDKLGELVSKAAEGTEIGQEARARLSHGISGALREVFVAKQSTIEGSQGSVGEAKSGGPSRAPEAASPDAGVQDSWKPDDYDIAALRTELEQSFGSGFAAEEEKELRARARQLAKGGFNPKRLAQVPY